MKLNFLVVSIFFFLFMNLFAQYVSISEVLDANLFKLSDGRIIKLAGVDAPSVNSRNRFLKSMAVDAISYTRSVFTSRRFILDSISTNERYGFQICILSVKYPLEKVNLSGVMLRNGFGKYIQNFFTSDTTFLKKEELYAQKKSNGIWKEFSPLHPDTLDPSLTCNGIQELIEETDSVQIEHRQPRPLYFAIPAEFFSGGIVAIISSLAGFGVTALTSTSSRNLSGIAESIMFGYWIGFPTGVYFMAKIDNPNLSFLLTVGSSIGMALVGIGASEVFVPNDHNHWLRSIIWFSPILGSLFYVHLLASQNPANFDSSLKPKIPMQSFKDFRDSQTLRVELFRINF